MTGAGWRREPAAARGGCRRRRTGVRESPRGWSEGIEGVEEMLTEARIGGGVAGEDAVSEAAVAAGIGEEPACAAPRGRTLQIG